MFGRGVELLNIHYVWSSCLNINYVQQGFTLPKYAWQGLSHLNINYIWPGGVK